MTNTIKNINKALKNTRFVVVTSADTVLSVREKLSDKFRDGKMYGVVYAYAINDDKLESILTAISDANHNETLIRKTLNANCTVGFEILDMTLKQRINQETSAIKLDIHEFSNIETSLRDDFDIDIPAAAKTIRQESKVACM